MDCGHCRNRYGYLWSVRERDDGRASVAIHVNNRGGRKLRLNAGDVTPSVFPCPACGWTLTLDTTETRDWLTRRRITIPATPPPPR
jgi:hypothetical protein